MKSINYLQHILQVIHYKLAVAYIDTEIGRNNQVIN